MPILHHLSSSGHRFLQIADNSAEFSTFSPYVATLNAQAEVVFQACLRQGGSGLFLGSGQKILSLAQTNLQFQEFVSHPVVSTTGQVAGFVHCQDGSEGLFLFDSGQTQVLAQTNSETSKMGPLGPVISPNGVIAFRTQLHSGQESIEVSTPQKQTRIACTGKEFKAFQGLPQFTPQGGLLFRAETQTGKAGYYGFESGQINPWIETGSGFESLGLFPALNQSGCLVFTAREKDQAGIYSWNKGKITRHFSTAQGFESFRGGLPWGAQLGLFYATPTGGNLGLYRPTESGYQCILALGETFADSEITEFALNPVSINPQGNLALRIKLRNRREIILRYSLKKHN